MVSTSRSGLPMLPPRSMLLGCCHILVKLCQKLPVGHSRKSTTLIGNPRSCVIWLLPACSVTSLITLPPCLPHFTYWTQGTIYSTALWGPCCAGAPDLSSSTTCAVMPWEPWRGLSPFLLRSPQDSQSHTHWFWDHLPQGLLWPQNIACG